MKVYVAIMYTNYVDSAILGITRTRKSAIALFPRDGREDPIPNEIISLGFSPVWRCQYGLGEMGYIYERELLD